MNVSQACDCSTSPTYHTHLPLPPFLFWSDAGTSEETKSIVGGGLKVGSEVEVGDTARRLSFFLAPLWPLPPLSRADTHTHTLREYWFVWSQVSKRTSGPAPSFSRSLLWVWLFGEVVCLKAAYVTADGLYYTDIKRYLKNVNPKSEINSPGPKPRHQIWESCCSACSKRACYVING